MTISYLSYETDDIQAFWLNNGLLLILKGERPKSMFDNRSGLNVKASELKQIIEHGGKWTGEKGLRPGMFPGIGQIKASVDGDDYVTITHLEHEIELPDHGEKVLWHQGTVTLHMDEWKAIYEACTSNREAYLEEHGGIVNQAVGHSELGDEI